MDEFEAALFLESTLPDIEPFGYITIPRKKYEDETVVKIDQMVEITSLEQFTRYNQLVLGSEEFRIAVRGRTDLEISGFPETTIDFNKVATMKGGWSFWLGEAVCGVLTQKQYTGLNGLEGLNITEVEVKIPAEEDGANMLGKVSIPNPSVITIHMGDVTLDLSVDGEPIGTSLLPDLVLKPGTHEYDMRSTVQTLVVAGLIQSDYPDGILPLEIVGNSSVVDGENIPYFEAAIQSNVIRLDLNAGPALVEAGLGGVLGAE